DFRSPAWPLSDDRPTEQIRQPACSSSAAALVEPESSRLCRAVQRSLAAPPLRCESQTDLLQIYSFDSLRGRRLDARRPSQFARSRARISTATGPALQPHVSNSTT